MTRRAASFTQADVARAIRAAKQEGAARVTVKVNGAEISVDLREPPLSTPQPVAPKRVLRL
tara:strand:+ start:623 stop:805 length:183 start_codon:yes stop_codon:yes gene_type:complete